MMETIMVNVSTQRDAHRLMRISAENGWKAQSANQLLDWLVATAPKDVPLSDEDIMKEIREVRGSYVCAGTV